MNNIVAVSPYCYPGLKRSLLSKETIESLKSVSIDSMDVIGDVIENYFWILLRRRCRKEEYTVPRFIYFHLCKKYTRFSLKEIGDSLNMDHTSVIHGLHALFDLLATEAIIRNLLREIELEIYKSNL